MNKVLNETVLKVASKILVRKTQDCMLARNASRSASFLVTGLALILTWGLALALAGPASAQVTVDSFTTNQATISDPPGGASSVAGGADILGGRRDLEIDLLLGGAGPASVGVAGGNLTFTVANTTPDSRGEATITWDGDSNPVVLSPTGLGGVDLTAGGASGLRLRVTVSNNPNPPAELDLAIYSSAVNFSRGVRLLAAGLTAQDVFIPFSELRPAGGTGADFTDVGAIVLTLRAREATVTVDEVVAATPQLAATKVDALLVDDDGDGRADPGDRIRYTITLSNTGSEALQVDLSDTVDPNTTLVTGSVSSTPVARNDQYRSFGHVTFEADGSPERPGLLANDDDADGDTVTVDSVSPTSVRGGTVTLLDPGTGTFNYEPPAGLRGVDAFTYTVTDDNGNLAMATASIALDGLVRFVDDSNLTPPFLGTQGDPYPNLTSLNGAGGVGDEDEPGDIIFLYADDGVAYAGGLELEADQHLIGERFGLILDGRTIVPAGGTPRLTHAAGNGLTLSMNNTVRGLDVMGPTGAGIAGTAFGTLTASHLRVMNAGGAALNLVTGTLDASFDSLSSAGTAGQPGLNLATVDGSLTSGSTTLTNPSGHGIRVMNSPASNLSFGTTTVTDNAIGAGPTATGIDLATGNAGATFDFTSLALTTDGAGLLAAAGTVEIGGAANTINATGGAALDLAGTNVGAGATFSTLSSSGSGGRGVRLDTVAGSVVATGGSITGATGIAFEVNGGASTVTYAGGITNSANRIAQVTARTGGTVTLSGNLNETGTGLRVANNTGGMVLFSGASKVLNTGTNQAITLDTNTGATIRFTGGGLDVDTSTGTAFSATGGAAGISVAGSNNSLTAADGVALVVTSTTIEATGLTFRSISSGDGVANGPATGISLSSTGSLGGLTVTGDGATLGSGGLIRNISQRGAAFVNARNVSLSFMDFTNANTVNGAVSDGTSGGNENTDENGAIHLQSVTNVDLTSLRINGAAQHGINGNLVTDLDITNSVIENTGNAVWESGIYLFQVRGTAGAGLTNTISNTTVRNTGQFNVFVQNNGATNAAPGAPDRLELTGCTFQGSGVTVPGDHVTVANRTTANFQTVVSGSSFTATPGRTSDSIQIDAGDSSTSDASITTSTFDLGNIAINLSGAGTSTTTFNVNGNTQVRSVAGTTVNVASNGSAVLRGTISNNAISTMAANNAGFGVDVVVDQTGSAVVVIDGNNITGQSTGIRGGARNPGAGSAALTIRNNTVLSGGMFPFTGLWLFAGNGSAGEANSVCVNLQNNTIDTGSGFGDPDYFLEQYTGNTFQIQGLAPPAGASEAQVEAFVAGTDADPSPTDPTVEAFGGLIVNYTAGTCATP